jgi:general secretion pathway protein G
MRQRGFSMIELMVALAILATILSIAVPRYFGNVDAAKESVLREDLYVMRDAIDKHFSDNGVYPQQLGDLVVKRYLRNIPVDPFTQNTTSWVTVAPADASQGAVYDVRSGAPDKARDGTLVRTW